MAPFPRRAVGIADGAGVRVIVVMGLSPALQCADDRPVRKGFGIALGIPMGAEGSGFEHSEVSPRARSGFERWPLRERGGADWALAMMIGPNQSGVFEIVGLSGPKHGHPAREIGVLIQRIRV